MRSHFTFFNGGRIEYFQLFAQIKMASGPRIKPKVRSVSCSSSAMCSAVQCNAMQLFWSMDVCVHLQRASQSRVRCCLCVTAARDAMMKRSGNGLLRREMKIRVVTQTRSGVSYLPTWGQWPFTGAGGRYLRNQTP